MAQGRNGGLDDDGPEWEVPASGGGGAARLALDDDERLPWLESADDDEDYGKVDTGRVIGVVLAGLAALVVIVGAIWWATNRRGEGELVADGSTIQPPAQPYKEKPKDPGGKTFAGTGDTSFAVSEGQTRNAKLAQSKPVPTPAPSAEPSPAASPSAPAVAGVGVQVAAYSNAKDAEAGWSSLSSQYEALKGLNHRVVEGRADIGTVYRLQAVTPDRPSASALCATLRSAGLACQVKG